MTSTMVLASEPRRMFPHLLVSLPILRTSRKVAYVWTAAKPYPDYPSWVNSNVALYESFGWQVNMLDIDGMNEQGLRAALVDRDLIFVEGGNTFFLLKAMRDSGFDSLIHEKIAEPDMIYMGCSAGSVVAGISIESASWPFCDSNDIGLTDLTGLGFIDDMIHPHYRPETMPEIAPYMEKSRFKTRLLSDEQALIVRDGVIHLMENPPLAA